MDRKSQTIKRSAKTRNPQNYEKRKMTKNTVRHYILYPVVPLTIGKSNDFYFHTLRLMLSDRNIKKDPKCKKLLQGLRLKDEELHNLDVGQLMRDRENGWFTSSRQNDLATIGKVVGYFLKCFASSVVNVLDEHFSPETATLNVVKELHDLFEVLRHNQAIVPVIIKLNISPHSKFDQSKFIYLTEDVVKILHDTEKTTISRRVELLNIKEEHQEQIWRLLNSVTCETRQEILEELMKNGNLGESEPDDEIRIFEENRLDGENETDDEIPINGENWFNTGNQIDGVPIDTLEPLIEITEAPIEPLKNIKKIERRSASSRSKQINKKYPVELYDIS